MKKVFLLCFMIVLGHHYSQAQCGTATNLSYQFSNGINTFAWDAVPNAATYELWITESGAFSAPELLATTTTNSFVTPGGLLSASYDYWIETVCQNSDRSTSTILTFTVPCPEPTNLGTTNIGQNSATLNWTNIYADDPMHENGVYLAYRPVGNSSWIQLATFDLTSSFNLANLVPNTAYEWCANLNCSYFDSSPVISTFTTLPSTCPAVTSQTTINITNTTAQLSWLNVGAQNYSIQYKINGSNSWTTIITPNSSSVYTLSGLIPNTTYYYRVASLCGANSSAYSSPTSFHTNCVSLDNNTEHIRFVQIKDKIRVSTADPNGYSMWNDAPTLAKGSTYIFKIAGGGQINTSNKQDVALFLDINQNNIFEYSERVAGVGMLHNTNAKTYSFTVPTNTLLGTTRARAVMMKQNQGGIQACPTFGLRGEIEDYTVTIISSASRPNDMTQDDQTNLNPLASRSKETAINVFPNPATDYLYVNGGNVSGIKVYNALGQVVINKTVSIDDEIIELDITPFSQGVLLIETVNLLGEKTINKVIKN